MIQVGIETFRYAAVLDISNICAWHLLCSMVQIRVGSARGRQPLVEVWLGFGKLKNTQSMGKIVVVVIKRSMHTRVSKALTPLPALAPTLAVSLNPEVRHPPIWTGLHFHVSVSCLSWKYSGQTAISRRLMGWLPGTKEALQGIFTLQ